MQMWFDTVMCMLLCCVVKYADAGSVALLLLCVSVLYISCNHH